MVETRIVAMQDGKSFVPQVKVKHFLWGHHWEGLYAYNGHIFETHFGHEQLERCRVDYETARIILERYTSRVVDKENLAKD